MLKSFVAVLSLLLTGVSQAVYLDCSLSSTRYTPAQPWPFDAVSLIANWAPLCLNFGICIQQPRLIGATVAIEQNNNITLHVYGSDTELPTGVTPQPQQPLVQTPTVQAMVGPLTPGSYTVTTRFHTWLDPNGNVDCPPKTMSVIIEQANGPVERLTAVEFYNASMDHYFISANPAEIADLDNGVHPGWARTGLAFNVFASGKSGGVGVPVCRFYGLPSAGLDSHFYTADQNECTNIPEKFHGAWQLESDNVFEVRTPTNGACPMGFVPVYRLWNQRTDSNHRFTTNLFVALYMKSRGYFWEGLPDGVERPITMCAPEAPTTTELSISKSLSPSGTTLLTLSGSIYGCVILGPTSFTAVSGQILLSTPANRTGCVGVPPLVPINVTVDVGVLSVPPAIYTVTWEIEGQFASLQFSPP